MSLVDRFVVQMPAFSTEKTKSHLLPNLTAKNRARKYPFHMDDRLKMQHCDQSSLEVRGGVLESFIMQFMLQLLYILQYYMYIQPSHHAPHMLH